jgi:hypothetical protein
MVETPDPRRHGADISDARSEDHHKAELGSHCSATDYDSQDDSPPRKRKSIWSCCLPSWSQSRKDPERRRHAPETVVDADVGLRTDFTMEIPDGYAIPQEDLLEEEVEVHSSRPPSPDKYQEAEPSTPSPSSKFVPAVAPVNGSVKPVPVVVPRLTFNKLPQQELLPRPPDSAMGLEDSGADDMEPPPLKRGPPDIEPPSSRESMLEPVPEGGMGEQEVFEEELESQVLTPRGSSKRRTAPRRDSARMASYLGTPSSALRKSLAREDVSSASQRLMGLQEIVDDVSVGGIYVDHAPAANHQSAAKKTLFTPNTPPRYSRYDVDEDLILDEPNFPAPVAPPTAAKAPSPSAGAPGYPLVPSYPYAGSGRSTPRGTPRGGDEAMMSPRNWSTPDRTASEARAGLAQIEMGNRKEEPNTGQHFTSANYSYGPETPRGGGDESVFLPISKTPVPSPRQVPCPALPCLQVKCFFSFNSLCKGRDDVFSFLLR